MSKLQQIYEEIAADPANEAHVQSGHLPVYTASETARIVIIGQAPGRKAQESRIPWNDVSGIRLRSWLGVTDEQFYNPKRIALVPMDFYYPGKGSHGDLPPRREFAPKWHPQILAEMPSAQLFILVGNYAQRYYLGRDAKSNLSLTVRAYEEYLPKYLPLVHPSPLNFRWLSLHPWFESELVPILRQRVSEILKD
jgi:uracil-DNA glycosylase